jgi:predicted AAA+ superfamily ATPase
VQAESLTRNLEGFARFLGVAAEWAGHHLDLSKLAAAAQVPRQSTVRFFEILDDTLIVRRAEPFTRSTTRRLVQHPKFFFFDVGVRNGLLGNFTASADRIGGLFEHLVFSQVAAGAAARDREIRVSSYRTEHGGEVDLIIEVDRRLWAIELKASRTVGMADLRGLRSFRGFYGRHHEPRIWYLGETPRVVEGVTVQPWQEGFASSGCRLIGG